MEKPTIIITTNGGDVPEIVTSIAMDVYIIDEDTSFGDPEDFVKVNGHTYHLCPSSESTDPELVKSMVAQIIEE